ncbi:MAG: lyase, partial [Gammaproteobacteria bacterium]|nr:lyase [Gammaproteobacteria bacterium]
MKRLWNFLFIVIIVSYSFAGQATDQPDIKEWLVPWEGTVPRDPYVDSEGRVWFCGQRGNYIAYLVPETGEFKRYEVETGTHPHNLIVDQEGFVWYSCNRNAHIGKLNPVNGKIKKFPMPGADARDPHTLVFTSESDIWFTLQQ